MRRAQASLNHASHKPTSCLGALCPKTSHFSYPKQNMPPPSSQVQREEGGGRFSVSDVCVLSSEQDCHAQLTLVGVKVDVAVILDGQANLVDVLGRKLIFAHALK